jgi:hypothetical protein
MEVRAVPSAGSKRLRDQLSAVLRDELLAELAGLGWPDEAAVWARKTLPAKNTLTEPDARLVENAFADRLASFETISETTEPTPAARPARAGTTDDSGTPETTAASANSVSAKAHALAPGGRHIPALEVPQEPSGIDKSALVMGEPRRRRNKAHLRFIAREPCVVCGRKPCDPHHLRFTQKRALGRKVSDEFCVPLCRTHHRELHRSGNEALWWENVGLDPITVAGKLWQQTRLERAGRNRPGLSTKAPSAITQATVKPDRAEAAVPSAPLAAERQ